MKYIIILGDGMADWPCKALGNKTPLAYAQIPNMDRIARDGRSGMLKTVKNGFEPGSDIANLSVLGYDPALYYTGRGPLEAVSMGVDLGPDEIAYRCNLVTVTDEVMQDFSAGHISSEEGAALFSSLNAALPDVSLYPGISYRNLLVVPNGAGAETTPPHDIVGENIAGYLPKGGDAPILAECVRMSREIFADHPVNKKRIADGKVPATQIWPWSGGKKPEFPSFEERYGVRGAMISAVDLLNGIARCVGMDIITVPGATGYLDTDYMAKARYAVAALETVDLVYMHVEAPDEAGHLGSTDEKVCAIERLDEAVGYILDHVDGIIALLPDHPTPLALKTHTSDPVPFAVMGMGSDEVDCYSEDAAEKGSFGLMDALDFILMLTGKNR
jgi:2,3-bisphosphoglycerate-independent phosphoglycerate mutase